MEPRAVPPGHGLRWIADGWLLFRRSPFAWIAMTALLLALWLLLLSLPKVGPLLFNLLFPVFFGGVMLGCRALEGGRPLTVQYLFAAFRGNAGPLVTIGGVYLVGMLIVMAVVFSGSDGLPRLPAKPTPAEIEEVRAALRKLTGPLLTGLALYLPLLMLTWFAPILVVFRDMGAIAAMRASFEACLRNMLPFLVYGFLVLGLWVVATLAVLVGLLIVLPVIFASMYVSYRDIFEPPQPPAAAA